MHYTEKNQWPVAAAGVRTEHSSIATTKINQVSWHTYLSTIASKEMRDRKNKTVLVIIKHIHDQGSPSVHVPRPLMDPFRHSACPRAYS